MSAPLRARGGIEREPSIDELPPLRKIVEKEIERSDATVAGDYEIGSRVGRRFARDARDPSNSSGIAYFLGRGEGLILEIGMRCFYHAGNTIDLVAATKCSAFRVIEHSVFVKELVDCSATTHGITFAKYVAEIAKQQGRDAVGHCGVRFGSRVARQRRSVIL